MQRLNQDLNIFVATHKEFDLPKQIDNDNAYIVSQVGVNNYLGYFSENQLDNIAYKNKNFCELTLLYFIWKNVSSKYVGLVHYRRYFYKKVKTKKIAFLTIPWKSKYQFLSKTEILSILNEYDIIIPKPYYISSESIRVQYEEEHHIKDWILTKNIISRLYPEYIMSFSEIENGKIFYGCNMFIGNKKVIDLYCEWLFNILFELENQVDISNYSDYQKRIFGFLSERLFTVWLNYNKGELKIYETHMRKIDL